MEPLSGQDETLRAARRRVAVVMVEGLGPMGIRIAEQLISFGIGTVLLRDEQPVTTADAGYRRADCGRPRAEAACQLLRPTGQPTAVLEAPEGSSVLGLDLHLVVTTDATQVQRLRSAAQNDSAVLPVELSGEGFCIGPLLRNPDPLGPDSLGSGSPCLECLVLHGLHEPASPQSHHGEGSAEPAELQPTGPLEAVAAGIAAHQAHLLVEGESAAAASGALFAQASTGRLGHRAVGPHPECRCLMTYSRSGAPSRRPHLDDGPRSRGHQSLEPTG